VNWSTVQVTARAIDDSWVAYTKRNPMTALLLAAAAGALLISAAF
jgi:hypothetical protein